MCLAVPVQIVELLPDQMATVELGGVRRQISTVLVDDVQVGDYVLVHVGYALNKVDPEQAALTLSELEEIAALGREDSG